MPATHGLWVALSDQAKVWARTPVVAKMRDELAGEHERGNLGQVAAVLQELKAAFGSVMTEPLRFGTLLPAIMQDQLVASRVKDAASGKNFTSWINAASQVEHGHRLTVAWYRSRLSGYPLILAPQLAPNSPLTTFEMTDRLIWLPDERTRGLQFEARPPGVDGVLGVEGILAREIDESARAVVNALEKTDEWRSFERARTSLDEEAKAELHAARALLTESLSAEAVDVHEPNYALPRLAYRAHKTAEIVESLSGRARDYALAFREVNSLIETATSSVFGRMVIYDEPIRVPASNVDLEPGDPVRVTFEVGSRYMLIVDCGSLLIMADPLVRDVVRVESTNLSFAAGSDMRLRATAAILENSDGVNWND
jgi:hypothetical protein